MRCVKRNLSNLVSAGRALVVALEKSQIGLVILDKLVIHGCTSETMKIECSFKK